MARIRYLKPDFFIDPDLGELSFQHRLIFAGLWCQADKAGRLRYEPKKLKIQIVPYDNIKMEQVLEELSVKPFIQIYEIEGVKYIQIKNWDRHQNPHHTEKESIIPLFDGILTVKEPLLNSVKPISSHICSNNKEEYNIKEVFEFFCLALKKKILLSPERKRIIQNRLQEGRTVEELKRAITNFSMDDWPDRHKFCDIIYAIGVRNKVDNLDKWLVGKDGGKPVPASHPKTCPECFGNGILYPQGGGKAVVCWVKY